LVTNIVVENRPDFLFTYRLLKPYVTKIYVDSLQHSEPYRFLAKLDSIIFDVYITNEINHFVETNPLGLSTFNDTIFITYIDGSIDGYTKFIRLQSQGFGKIVSLENDGEIYHHSKSKVKCMDMGLRILSSNLDSVTHSPEFIQREFHTNIDVETRSHQNFIQNAYSAFLRYQSLIHLEERWYSKKENIAHNFDIAFYHRDGYKGWRDVVSKYLLSNSEHLNVKKVSDLRHLNVLEYDVNEDDTLESVDKIFLNLNKVNLHNTYFNDMYDAKMHITFETCLEEPEVFVTEKTFKEYYYGFPFYNCCSYTMTKELERLGFFSYDMLQQSNLENFESNHSLIYNLQQDCITRFKQFVDTYVTTSKVDDLWETHRDKFQNNISNLYHLISEKHQHRTELIHKLFI
jgi:hypothetical protein